MPVNYTIYKFGKTIIHYRNSSTPNVLQDYDLSESTPSVARTRLGYVIKHILYLVTA